MRVAIYARVSTKEQTCENQLAELRELCARRGWEAVEFVDQGVSGAKLARPALDDLLRRVRAGGEFEAVVVWKIDRFARSTRFLAETLHEFAGLGVQFISHRDALDTTTAIGQFIFHIMAALAEFEREMIRERVRCGIQRAHRAGIRSGPPWRALDDETLEGMLATGQSMRSIARALRCGLGTIRRRAALKRRLAMIAPSPNGAPR